MKVVEVPPGPPVIQTLVAEIYGPTAEGRERVARQVKQVFASTPSVVDVDWYMGGVIVGFAALANRGFCKRVGSDLAGKPTCSRAYHLTSPNASMTALSKRTDPTGSQKQKIGRASCRERV